MGYVRPDYDGNYKRFKKWVYETINEGWQHHDIDLVEDAISKLEKEIAIFSGASNQMFSAEKRIYERLQKGSKELKKCLEKMV